MRIQQLLELTEISIQRVRGIGNLETRVTLVSEQVRKVGPNTSVCRTKPAMRVLPMFVVGCISSLIEYGLPPLQPDI